MAAILIAKLANMVSGTDEASIGGKLMEPKMVIASRNKKVAPTIRGNLADPIGGNLAFEFDGPCSVETVVIALETVDLP